MIGEGSPVPLSRRDVLRASVGGATAAAALRSTGTVAAQERPDFGGWLDGVDGGFTDARGQSEVTVMVGADGNNGAFAFEPAGVWVDPGTTIKWEWTGDGGGHNVHAQEGADFESDVHTDAGVHFEYTFEDEGIVTYQCDPHATLGMKGAVAVGGDVPTTGGDTGGAPGGAQRPDFGGWLDGVDGGFSDARGQSEVTVAVGAEGNTGNFAFNPAGLWVDPGTTVTWEWTGEGGGHNVHAQEGADFESDIHTEPGSHFQHTFDQEGIVTYQCDPHASLGMKGAIAVGDNVPLAGQGPSGDGGARPFPAPGGLLGFSLMVLLLGAAAFAVLSVSAGEYYRSLRARGSDEHISAHLAAAVAVVLGTVAIVAVVLRLLV